MKKMKLGMCFALALAMVFAFGLYAPAKAGNLDATWYKGRIQGDTRLFIIDADDQVQKIKLNGDFYFKLCGDQDPPDGICGGVGYTTILAVADFNDDGEYTADEAFTFDVSTCGLTEESFLWGIVATDVDPDTELDQSISGAGLGRVKGEDTNKLRANAGNGGGAVNYDDLNLAFGPNGYFRKVSIKADPKDVADLPFDPTSAAFFAVFGTTLCLSEIPAGLPTADAGADQAVAPGVVTLVGGGVLGDGAGPLTYAWSLIPPPGSAAVLSDATVAGPTFTADLDGTYRAVLVVNDGLADSLPDLVVITVTTP